MPMVRAADPAAPNGVVHSHRFAAANTALPFVNGDTTQLQAVQNFLRAGAVSVDIFGLVRGDEPALPGSPTRAATEPRLASTSGVGEESMDFGAAQNYSAPPA